MHLASRIPPPERLADREAWRDTDRLRAEATPILVDAALAASVEWFLFPSTEAFEEASAHEGKFVLELRQAGVTLNVRRL